MAMTIPEVRPWLYIHMSITEQEAGVDLCSPFVPATACAVTITIPVTTVFFSRPIPLAEIPDRSYSAPAADFTAIPGTPRFS